MQDRTSLGVGMRHLAHELLTAPTLDFDAKIRLAETSRDTDPRVAGARL